jgi:hypothetical protein
MKPYLVLTAALVLGACGTTEETIGDDTGTDTTDDSGGGDVSEDGSGEDSGVDTGEPDTGEDATDAGRPDIGEDTVEPDTGEDTTEPDTDVDTGEDTTELDAGEDIVEPDINDDATDAGGPCDRGTLICDLAGILCERGLIAAVQGGCWVCVDPDTCEEPPPPPCEHPSTCDRAEWCDPCATSSCPDCFDCIAACVPHACDDPADLLACRMLRPTCDGDNISIVRDGCWVCVDPNTCEAPAVPTSCEDLGGYCVGAGAFCRLDHDAAPEPLGCGLREQCCLPVGTTPPRDCNDGSEPLCDRIPPTCTDHEVLVVIDSCETCVNPATCLPWGERECGRGLECERGYTCDECGTSSCPFCEDCIGACVPLGAD